MPRKFLSILPAGRRFPPRNSSEIALELGPTRKSYKCDICRKEIKDEAVMADFNKHFSTQTFCLKCGKPVVDFLNKIKRNKNE